MHFFSYEMGFIIVRLSKSCWKKQMKVEGNAKVSYYYLQEYDHEWGRSPNSEEKKKDTQLRR